MAQRPKQVSRQQPRGDETRRAVLDAAVETLTELGYRKTTTLEVQRRAGVSRGAMLHHFPSRADLLAATIVHLARLRGREIKAKEARLPVSSGQERVGAAIDLIWESFTGPMFYVGMELRAAARTDDEFRDIFTEAERDVLSRIVYQSKRLFGREIASHPGFSRALDMTLQLMIGAAMTAILHREPAWVAGLIRDWKRLFPILMEEARDTGEMG